MVIHVEVYLAAKQLEAEGFETYSQADLQRKIEEMFDDTRSGLGTHIVSICNASAPKNNAIVYNYLTRVSPGRYRVFRDGDEVHPSREGAATKPSLEQVKHIFWPLWADNEGEAPVVFKTFSEDNFNLFETEQKKYQAGDPIGEVFKNKMYEWEQFIQKVVARTGFKFVFSSEKWQNSGYLSNELYWSRLREKGKENYATCFPFIILKDRIVVSLGYHKYFDNKGKALDNYEQYSRWLDYLDTVEWSEEQKDQYSVLVWGKQNIRLRTFLKDPQVREKIKAALKEDENMHLNFGREFSKQEALAMGEDIVEEAAKVVESIYPLYKKVLQMSQDTMYLIGSATELDEWIERFQNVIREKGAVMYWWSYVIREEYRTHLQKNLPLTLYIYGVTEQKKRAITHRMTVSEFFSVSGNEGQESPYPVLTLAEDRGIKRKDETQSTIFKTWLKVTSIEKLLVPIGLDEFVYYDTKGFINPSGMVNSFIYARKIPADSLAARLANCLNITLEHFGFRLAENIPLEKTIRENKGFSFDLKLDEESAKTAGVKRISGSRYKNENKLLLHVAFLQMDDSLRNELLNLGYNVWLKDGKERSTQKPLEDDHVITTDADAHHVKVVDINLDHFSVNNFTDPLEDLFAALDFEVLDGHDVDSEWKTFDISDILHAIKESEFVYSEQLIINLHNCLNALSDKHFLILSGISGTGKTRFTQTYVNALYGLPPGDRNNPFFALIPVQPQWSDRTGLLGYFNPITGKYHRPMFLNHLLRAMKDPRHSYFVCLDEMNLAVVEHYFADILSAMESGQRIELHAFETAVDGVPPFVEIPMNFFVVGTVNVDETTHQFSPKVLDRAYTIEFNVVQLDRFMKKFKTRPEIVKHGELLDRTGSFCQSIFETLESKDMHFAYRTCKEILSYMVFNEQSTKGLDYEAALDYMVMQKILPKIRGDEKIEPVLQELEKKIATELGDYAISSVSLKRIREMISELQEYGSCQFWR